MAEQARKVSTEESVNRRNQWKETAAQVGMLALTGFLTGISMAAGGHAYQAISRRCGGQPNNVTPLRKIV